MPRNTSSPTGTRGTWIPKCAPRIRARQARGGDGRLSAATIYSSLEPCSVRKSRPRSCAELLLAAGVRRVVFAMREPSLFVDGRGAETLRDAGVTVVQLDALAEVVEQINAHLLGQLVCPSRTYPSAQGEGPSRTVGVPAIVLA